MESKSIDQATKQLIDALKQTCGAFGLGNDGNEYKIIVQVFLYKYFNDKFGYEAKKTPGYGERLNKAEKWDEEYDKFTDDEIEDLFTFLPSNTPKMRPEHTIAHLYNAQGQGDFSNLFQRERRQLGDNRFKRIKQENAQQRQDRPPGDGFIHPPPH